MSTRPTASSPLTFNDLDLLLRLCNQLRRHLDRGFDDHHNLSYDQVQVLWHIAANEGDCRPSTATGLDEVLALQAPAKRHVAALIKAGLVEEDTESHWRDNRRKQLRLTRQGQVAVRQLDETWRLIAREAFMNSDEGTLRRLSVALRDLAGVPDELRKTFAFDGLVGD